MLAVFLSVKVTAVAELTNCQFEPVTAEWFDAPNEVICRTPSCVAVRPPTYWA